MRFTRVSQSIEQAFIKIMCVTKRSVEQAFILWTMRFTRVSPLQMLDRLMIRWASIHSANDALHQSVIIHWASIGFLRWASIHFANDALHQSATIHWASIRLVHDALHDWTLRWASIHFVNDALHQIGELPLNYAMIPGFLGMEWIVPIAALYLIWETVIIFIRFSRPSRRRYMQMLKK